MAFLSTRSGQFTYFALELGDFRWGGKDVLDFGGNIGNILQDPNSTIDVERYWCIDVVNEAVKKGKISYPQAHWLFYNRYCFFFNPSGVPHLNLPKIEQRFDYVVAYSVFSNTSRTDMLELVDELRGLLKSDGTLAFSFIDPHYHSWPKAYGGNNLQYRLMRIKAEENPDIDTESVASRARHASWCFLVNDSDLYIETEEIEQCEPDQQKSCYAFYTVDYMKSLFPEAIILPPVNDEMQHCCIMKSS
jgi:hypothetical protein